MMRRTWLWLLPFLLTSLAARVCHGKEAHLAHLRVLLISRAARCTTCHVDEAGKSFNRYGKQLADDTDERPLSERLATLEAGDDEDEGAGRHDVDGDGVLNWIEILAGNSPADAKSKPDPAQVERIEAVISCRICHVDVHRPGKVGLEANPHNELGALLATTVPRQKGRRRPVGPEAVREAAEATPILARLDVLKSRKPKRSKVSYWEKIRLICAPCDSKDKPPAKRIGDFRKQVRHQRRKSTRDPTLGLDCTAHPADGFLTDAKTLP